jgi:RNA polymerase sigma-70 factor (ECF subfamily)
MTPTAVDHVTHELTDWELVRRCLEGDRPAERVLYERHIDRVYRTAYRMSGDHDVAADYAQETFIRAFSQLGQLRGEHSLGGWLRSITASVVMAGERRRSRRAVLSLEAFGTGPALAPSARRFDIADIVAAALDRMSEKLRSVFLMYDVEGYSHAEIATALGIPEGTSKARLSDARARLRLALKDYAEEMR